MSVVTPSNAERRALDRRVLAWIAEASRPEALAAAEGWGDDDGRFGELALALFRFQVEHCDAYARFCEASGVPNSDAVDDWRNIPAVPTGAFKEARLACFPESETRVVFRTSGTSTARRGALHLDDPGIYEAAMLASLRRFFVPECEPEKRAASGSPLALGVLAASPNDARDSSLSYMFGGLLGAMGEPLADRFFVREGRLDVVRLEAFLSECSAQQRAVALCGTAFSFVHWLDSLGERGAPALLLPAASRILETGGFKGRAREVSREVLCSSLCTATGIAAERIVNQYGMTELGSQFYDSTLVDADGPRRKLRPPWVRVRVVDPESGRDAAPGTDGLLVIHDLANTGSVAAVQTADLGRTIGADGSGWGDGFEVLGRASGAEARGCSIAADAMFSATLGERTNEGARP